jgi:methionine synthase II (cobalamin-independent)
MLAEAVARRLSSEAADFRDAVLAGAQVEDPAAAERLTQAMSPSDPWEWLRDIFDF